MKTDHKLIICLASAMTLGAVSQADDEVLPGNPYAVVVARNIFGLNPPPPPGSTTPDDATLPKITPNGIMSIFGQLQVLFKVASKDGAGKAVPDQSYILSEGQRQDDIEVVKINEKGGLVTFDNHGTVQELALEKATASGGPGVGPGGAGGAVPASRFAPTPGGVSGGGFNNNGVNTFGNRPAGNVGGRNSGGASSSASGGINHGGLAIGATSANAITQPGYHPDGPPMDPAVQAVMMAAQREQAKSTGDPIWQLIPDPIPANDSNPNEGH